MMIIVGQINSPLITTVMTLSVQLNAAHIRRCVPLSTYIIIGLLASIWILLSYILVSPLSKGDGRTLIIVIVVELRDDVHTVVILREIRVGRGAGLQTDRIRWRFLVWGRLEAIRLFIDVCEDCCSRVCLIALLLLRLIASVSIFR